MDIFYKKSALKGQRYSITESLTSYRLDKLKKAQSIHGKFNVWTKEGRIFVKEGRKITTPNLQEI